MIHRAMDRFGDLLRRLRSDRGLSLPALGRLVTYSGSLMWDLEHGRRRPNPDLAIALDHALGAGGRLAALAQPVTAAVDAEPRLPDWSESDRLAAGFAGHVRPDRVMVDDLAGLLAVHRRAEDTSGARVVLAPTLAHLETVEALRTEADGDLHDELLSLEAQYAQFVGWIYQDLGQRAAAEQWYARALSRAVEAGDDNMVASVLSMRSNTAWGAGEIRRAVSLGRAAIRPRDATPGVLALSHQQLARAHAAAGDRAEAEAHLSEATHLSGRAAADPEREPPSIYFLDEARLTVQRAICYRELGDHRRAVDLFREALAVLPAAYRRDRGQYLARLAVALAAVGEREESRQVADEARQVAAATGSVRTLAELKRAA